MTILEKERLRDCFRRGGAFRRADIITYKMCPYSQAKPSPSTRALSVRYSHRAVDEQRCNHGATLVSRRLLLRFPVAGSTCPVRFLPFARTATVWRFLREYIGRGQTHHIYHIGGGGGRGTELDEIGRGAFFRSDSSNLHHANHRSCQSSSPLQPAAGLQACSWPTSRPLCVCLSRPRCLFCLVPCSHLWDPSVAAVCILGEPCCDRDYILTSAPMSTVGRRLGPPNGTVC